MEDYSLWFRVLLILGSVATIVFFLMRIRKAKIQIEDSLFWFIFPLCLLVLSIFPELAFWAAKRMGFQSPINVVYLLIIFLLIIKQFFMTMQISQLSSKVDSLAQKIALNEERIERKSRED